MLTQQSLEVARQELLARTDSFVPPFPSPGGSSKCSNARLRPAIRNNILSATDINDAHVSMRQGTLANYMCTLGFARPPLEGHDYRTSDVLGLVHDKLP